MERGINALYEIKSFKEINNTIEKSGTSRKGKNLMDNKTIRFIDSDYKNLFTIPDGEGIKITYPDDRGEITVLCKFLDEYHTQIGNSVYHICQFAEIMEGNGAKYEPNKQLEKAQINVASFEESSMFYRNKQDDSAIGLCSGNFGNGDRFRYNWGDFDKGNNTPSFQAELQTSHFRATKGFA